MTIPTDTLFARQWYLRNTESGEFDLNVVGVWDNYTGRGVKVVVIDNGFEYDHPELIVNYDTELDYDYGSGDDDAAPLLPGDNHGTPVMGIIGAARDYTGVVGVAYESTLIGARIVFEVGGDTWTANLVAALDDSVAKGADIVNMSFAGASDFDNFSGPANLVLEKQAVAEALEQGRDGLGMILVKSAGNGRPTGTDVNHNQSDNNSGAIIVAAVNRDGFVSDYSSYGSATLVSAFGSPNDGGRGEIVTADRLGAAGYASGDYDFGFSGTSAATAMVSGVVALMLEANSDLGWRDVQTILANTARHVGSWVDGVSLARSEENPWSLNGSGTWNGGGMHFSRDYGYGLVDALAAVRLAESWTARSTSANEASATLDLLDDAVTLGDGDLAGTTFTGTMTADIDIERVTVTIGLQLDQTKDLDIYLVSPDGERQLLVKDQGDASSASYVGDFTYHSQAYRGESSVGDWQVQLIDDKASDATTVTDIKIEVFGSAASKRDTYVYTDEFSDFLNINSFVLKDRDGGTDTLNAAAVTSSMKIDLATNWARIDHVPMKAAGIENVSAGTKDDRITGSMANNDLAGGRGGDELTGAEGKDDFIYWTVWDSKLGGRDLITDFGNGRDRIDLRGIDADTSTAVDDAFRLIGGAAFSGAAGELHFYLNPWGKTFIEGDVDGDGLRDFEIRLLGDYQLVESDFRL